MQRSDDELNAVRLCPGRDRHVNIALIRRSVCCMLITATLSLLVRRVRRAGEKRQTLSGFNLLAVVTHIIR